MKELALNIVSLVRELILNTRGFWRIHSDARESQDELFKNLLFPLLSAVAIAVFLGEFFRSEYFRIWVALLWVIREIILFGTLYFIGIYGSLELIKYFGYEEKKEDMEKLVSYSLVPFLMISMVTGLFPFFYFLDIFGVSGFYVFFIGSRRVLHFPKEKRDNLILKIIAANWIVFGLLSFITAKLLTILD
ncbi:MAG TPA: YIP1 family protein [Draconibacterium sp.]|nr:YIP1 family protein [Draconibacterium sp.]